MLKPTNRLQIEGDSFFNEASLSSDAMPESQSVLRKAVHGYHLIKVAIGLTALLGLPIWMCAYTLGLRNEGISPFRDKTFREMLPLASCSLVLWLVLLIWMVRILARRAVHGG